MKRLVVSSVCVAVIGASMATGLLGKENAAALRGIPLDGAFKDAATADQIQAGLLKNAQFKKALKAAAEAKAKRMKEIDKTPIGPTPDQAARVAFLETLNAE